ncbi:MAG: DUF4388 domain-containing protein [Planctomycetota bacterium]
MDDGRSIVVMMPKIARKTLGLRDGPFSHVGIEAGSICLRGDSMTDGQHVVLPVSTIGTFHHDLLNNLFVYLSNTRQNGMLVVTTGPLTKVVFFKAGQIVFAGSTDATDRIGNVLIKLGYATPEQIEEVATSEDPRRFGVRVKESGYIDYDQLWDALRVQITDICCSLVRFPVSSYFFLPNVVPGDAFTHFLIEPTQILFQGMIEMDERSRHVETLAVPDSASLMEAFAAMEESETGTGAD